MKYSREKLFDNIDATAKLLQLESKEVAKVALKQLSLFSQKPETILDNINRTSNLLQIETKEFIQSAIQHPQLFYQKPKTIVQKVRIIQYYKQVQNKKSDEIVFLFSSDNVLYGKILNYLVKKSDGLKRAIDKKEFIKYLENKNKVYNFEIPKNEVAQGFIQFAKKFSKEHFGKQIFLFKILKR